SAAGRPLRGAQGGGLHPPRRPRHRRGVRRSRGREDRQPGALRLRQVHGATRGVPAGRPRHRHRPWSLRRREAQRDGRQALGGRDGEIARVLQPLPRHPGGELMAAESQLIRAYGDRRDDGVIQLSFTLPVPLSDKAKEAARLFCTRLGLVDVKVAAAEPAGDNYTFFVVYARADVSLDYGDIDVPEVVFRKLGFDDLNKLIEDRISRRVVVLGACTGSDTHTVGIDAILNMKGYSGDYGLERYPWFEAYNLGSQVPNEDLIRKAEERKADAI